MLQAADIECLWIILYAGRKLRAMMEEGEIEAYMYIKNVIHSKHNDKFIDI